MCQLMGDDDSSPDETQRRERFGVDDNPIPLSPLVRVDLTLGGSGNAPPAGASNQRVRRCKRSWRTVISGQRVGPLNRGDPRRGPYLLDARLSERRSQLHGAVGELTDRELHEVVESLGLPLAER